MAWQDRWRNEDRRNHDDDGRDWRSSGDDWRRTGEDSRRTGDDARRTGDDWRRTGDDIRRGEDWRRSEDYRSARRNDESRASDYGGGRDYPSYGGSSDDVRRRDVSGYGGGMGGDYSRYGFDRFSTERYNADRPGGIYGPESPGYGSGSNFYDRDHDWGRGGGYGRDDAFGYDRSGSRSRAFGSGWNDDRWSSRNQGRDERGFMDKAADEVASWFGDRGAERRREDDHRGRGPKSYTRSDDRIREDINDRLTDDSYVDATGIDVVVSGSEVTLSGMVDSRDQRRRAEDIAERISGVRHVQNNLRVRDRSGSSGGMAGSTTGATTGANLGETAFGRDTSTGATTDRTNASGSTDAISARSGKAGT